MVKKKVTVQAGDNGSNFGNPIKKVGQDVDVLSKQLASLGVDMAALTSMFDRRYLQKTTPDVAYEAIKFEKEIKIGQGLSSVNSKSGRVTGIGTILKQNYDGTNELEIDYISVRRQMFINELIIQQAKHTTGININSAGGLNCNRVELIDDTADNFPKQVSEWISDPILYRCYFDNKDGREPNTFTVGDCVLCQRIDFGDTSSPLKYYRKRVLGVGANYIDLESGGYSLVGVEYREPSNGDDIAQWGHLWNKSRQSIIELNTLEGGRQSFFRKMGDCRDALPENDRDFADYNSLSDANKQLLWESDLWYNDIDKTTIEIGYIDKGDGTYHDAVAIKGNFSATSKVGNKVYGIVIDNETGMVTIGAQKVMIGSSLLDVSEEIESAKNDAQSANDKIDNLEIGGINLANQSFGKTSGAYFTYNGEVTDDVAPSGQVSLSYTKIGAGTPPLVSKVYGAAKAGDTLTASIWVKSSVAGARLTFYQAGTPQYRKDKLSTKANEWERVVFTHTIEQDLTNLIIYGYLPAVDGAEVLISSFQVERGSKVTDFRLSDADQKAVNESYTDTAIADSESKIDYLKEAIQEGATSEVKGVALAELMVVREGDTTEDVRAGMSGIKDDGVAFFAGESDAYNKAVTFITDLRSDTLEKKAEFPNFLVDDAGQSYVKRMLVQGGSQTPFYFIDSADDVVDLGVFSNVILEKEGYKATLVYPSEGVDNGVVINIINNSYGDYAPVKYESFNFYEGLSDGYLRLKVLKNQQVTLTGFAVGYLSRVNKLAGYAVTRQMIGGSFTLHNNDYQTDVVEANTMVSPNGQITQWGQVTMTGARQRVYVNSSASRFPLDKSQVSIIMTPYSLDGIPRTYEIVDIQSTWFDMVARDARTGAEIAGKFSWVAYHPRG